MGMNNKNYKSIKAKYTTLLVGAVLLTAILVGGGSSLLMHQNLMRAGEETMNLHCQADADQVNDVLRHTQSSVQFMKEYSENFHPEFKELMASEELRADYAKELMDIFMPIAKRTRGTMSYYIRYNAEYFSPREGVLYSRVYNHERISDGYIPLVVTDVSMLGEDSEDMEWYYRPIKTGKGTWIHPYWGENFKMNMISYVEPIRIGGKIIGIVGMDIDFDGILEVVRSTKVYESSKSYLVGDDGDILTTNYSEKKEGAVPKADKEEVLLFADKLNQFSSVNEMFTYKYRGVDKCMVYYSLDNNMKLVMVANAKDIFDRRNLQILLSVLISLGIAVVVAFIGFRFSVHMTKPLEKLAKVAIAIGTGDMQVEIPGVDRTDEVGDLARAFNNTKAHLKMYMDYVESLAYKDALTGVQNKAAYDVFVEEMNVDISLGKGRFALIMVDLNYLKKINDTFGHEIGNRYILNLCSKITALFEMDTIYRIGGDEFIVTVRGEAYDRREELLAQLRESLKITESDEGDPWDNVSAATGMATYNPEEDDDPESVFKRADTEMYNNKLAMKAARE